ncbi:aldo/keto reductase [Marinobacteraceae bacterium S3BR75-40.1]
MHVLQHRLTRRRLLRQLALSASALALPSLGLSLTTSPAGTRTIPSSGERIPRVGLGSWITFNVGKDPVLLDQCADVIAHFFQAGGRLIDSSPMYGSSQHTIGYGLKQLGQPESAFSADKVWTLDVSDGPAQIRESLKQWGEPRFDLLQVHNLLAWEGHLKTLFAMQEAGDLRYVGITTSHGRRHDEFEKIMRSQPLDFVQFTYNIVDREAEERLLPLAADRGMAVIVNRPYQQGALIRKLQDKPLPPWASEIGALSWAQFILKFILSHPAVTCAIPATTRVDHVLENMAVATSELPDAAMRERMAAYVRAL